MNWLAAILMALIGALGGGAGGGGVTIPIEPPRAQTRAELPPVTAAPFRFDDRGGPDAARHPESPEDPRLNGGLFDAGKDHWATVTSTPRAS